MTDKGHELQLSQPFVAVFKGGFADCIEGLQMDDWYSPNGRFLVQETFPKTLPRFILILISLQRWQHRARNKTKHFVSPHLIGPNYISMI